KHFATLLVSQHVRQQILDRLHGFSWSGDFSILARTRPAGSCEPFCCSKEPQKTSASAPRAPTATRDCLWDGPYVSTAVQAGLTYRPDCIPLIGWENDRLKQPRQVEQDWPGPDDHAGRANRIGCD